MRSVEMAVAADFFRRGMFAFPVVLLALITLPIWLYTALDPQRMLGSDSHEAVVLHVTLTFVMGAGAAVAVFHAQGSLARYFVRPISAARLVTCQLMLGMVTVAAMYLIAGSLVNLLGAQWPLLGPAMFLATAMCCSLAAIWALEGSVAGQFLGCTATSIPLVIWFSRCYGATVIGDWKKMWLNPTAGEAVTLAFICLVACGVAVSGVTRVRRGDVWDFAAIWNWLDKLLVSNRSPARFGSAWRAQVWCNWREKFVPLPASFLLLINFVAISAWLSGWMPADEMLGFVVVVPTVVMTTVMPLVYGLVAGSCGKDGKPGMRHTLATLPVSDSLIAAALLRTCAAAILWSWLACAFSAAVAGGLVYLDSGSFLIEETLHLQQFERIVHFVPPAVIVLISWTLTALMASLVATGRPWLWALILCSAFGSALGISLLKLYLPEPTYHAILAGWLFVSGTFAGFCTLSAFVVAARRRLISATTIVPAVAVWLIVAVFAAVLWQREGGELLWLWQMIGLLSLTIAPFALMPLAVCWSRHR